MTPEEWLESLKPQVVEALMEKFPLGIKTEERAARIFDAIIPVLDNHIDYGVMQHKGYFRLITPKEQP